MSRVIIIDPGDVDAMGLTFTESSNEIENGSGQSIVVHNTLVKVADVTVPDTQTRTFPAGNYTVT